MKKIGFVIVLVFSSWLLGPRPLSVVYAQDSSVADVATAPDEPALTNDPSVRHISTADSIRAKSAHLFVHRYRVGHSARLLDVKGTYGEDRPINVHLWYPALSSEGCENSGNSNHNGHDQGCSATSSVYTSRLNGVPLLPHWDPLSWTIGSSESFDDLH